MIVAGIVAFEPDLIRLQENLEAVARQVDATIVYDNGSSNGAAIANLVDAFPGGWVIQGKTNDGIAAALNRLAEAAVEHGATALLTLDQDSVCAEEMVAALAAELNGDVAMVTPYIVDRNKVTMEQYQKLALPAVDHYRQPARRGAITSGALLCLSAWADVGGFDELFFIDYVDYDLNQRLLEKGYKILRVNSAPLLHEVGRARPTWLWVPRKDLAGRWHIERFFAFGHRPERSFYKARNRVLFTRKHGRALGITHEGIWQLPQQALLILLFDQQRLLNLRYFARGVWDGSRTPLPARSSPPLNPPVPRRKRK